MSFTSGIINGRQVVVFVILLLSGVSSIAQEGGSASIFADGGEKTDSIATVPDNGKSDSLIYEGFGCRMSYPGAVATSSLRRGYWSEDFSTFYTVHDVGRGLWIKLIINNNIYGVSADSIASDMLALTIEDFNRLIPTPTEVRHDSLGGAVALRVESFYSEDDGDCYNLLSMTAVQNGYPFSLECTWTEESDVTREYVESVFSHFQFTGKPPSDADTSHFPHY